MIPEAEGDSTPLGQRPLCVLPVVFRLWASVRLAHVRSILGSLIRFSVPAARHTVSYVKVVGQDSSPSKCVLLSTSETSRRRMTAWRNENEGCFWAVKLDVRDLGGHLDVTLRAVAGTLSSRVLNCHHSSHFSWSPPHGEREGEGGERGGGVQRMLGMVCSKLPGELHGCEGAAIPSCSCLCGLV